MYEDFWGLTHAPFNESHTKENFVEYSATELAKVKLRHIAEHGQCAAAIVGSAGIGKTALAKSFSRQLKAEGWAVSYVVNPLGSPDKIIKNIAQDLGGTSDDPAEALVEAIAMLCEQNRKACIIIDEAHTIKNMELLENIRMLMNFEVEGMNLTVILVGQEGLLKVLKKASSFNQRLSLKISLHEMNEDESKHYILSRLKSAGCQRGIFTRNAAEKICELSRGIPREINRLCELAMITGYGFALKKIKGNIVDMVADELSVLEVEEDKPEVLPVIAQEDEYIPLAKRIGQQKADAVSLSGRKEAEPIDFQFPIEKEVLPSYGLLQATYGDINENTPILKEDIMSIAKNAACVTQPPENIGEDLLASIDANIKPCQIEEDILANN